MSSSVGDPLAATPEKNEDKAELAVGKDPAGTGSAPDQAREGSAAVNETATDSKPGCDTATAETGTTKEITRDASATAIKSLAVDSGTPKGPECATAGELLPNGIPKIVFDVGAPGAADGDRASSETSGVHLDAADSHLDLQIDKSNLLKATCMHTGGFQYMWKGVRTTHGVKGKGKYYFEVKVGPKPANVVMPDTPANTQHVCRVGVSQPLTSLHLGDTAESWGFGGTGKKSTNRKFLDYGGPFGEGDVIGVVVDLDALTLAYTKNGQFLGTAFELPQRVRDTGLFPHIYVKNFDFQVNLQEKTKWFAPPGQEITFLGDVKEQDLMANPVEHPKNVSECEFIMMCGLPACGKTYWAEKHMEAHAAKSYVLLGTNAVIDQMKVMGLKRQANYATRWEELMSTATEVFNSLVSYAGSGAVPRNIIIDQTNVFKRARSRKVQPFLAWGTRRCVVMVTDERTLQQRTEKREREEGKMVPVSAVMDMKAAFVLPSRDDGFNVIDYVEMPEMESKREIRRINDEGRAFKANNPGMNNRQPKPHIETRAAPGQADAYPAKRHKGDQWQDPPQQSWGFEGPPRGQNDWSRGNQQAWGSQAPQAGWQQQQWGGWNSSNQGGASYPRSDGVSYGYNGQGSRQQGFNRNDQGQQYGDQRCAGGYGNQQGYSRGGDSGYYNSQGGYDSRYSQSNGGQHLQQNYGDSRSQYAGSGQQWQGHGSYGDRRREGSYSGGYYPPQGRY